MSILWNSVNLSSDFTTIGIMPDDSTWGDDQNTGLDGSGPGTGGTCYSSNLMPSTIDWQSETFNIGASDAEDIIAFEGQNIPLLGIQSNILYFLGLSTSGSTGTLTFQVHYADSATSDFFQSMSDWANYQGFGGETEVFSMSYRNRSDGSHDYNTFWVYGYSFALDPTRIPASFTLPTEDTNPSAYILAINQAMDLGADAAIGGGSGVTQATYNITGSGGATGSDEINTVIFIDTENSYQLLCENGDFLIVSGEEVPPNNVSLTCNARGSGGSICGGIGSSRATYSIIGYGSAICGGNGSSSGGSGNTYYETGSGGCLISVESINGYIPGPITVFNNSCKVFSTISFYKCRGAYIPTLTRCNQQIIDALAENLCTKINN
jgi:hypothetical protein